MKTGKAFTKGGRDTDTDDDFTALENLGKEFSTPTQLKEESTTTDLPNPSLPESLMESEEPIGKSIFSTDEIGKLYASTKKTSFNINVGVKPVDFFLYDDIDHDDMCFGSIGKSVEPNIQDQLK